MDWRRTLSWTLLLVALGGCAVQTPEGTVVQAPKDAAQSSEGAASASPVLGVQQVVDALLAGLNAADEIFSEVNWHRLRGSTRVLRGWRVVRPDGTVERADIEVAFVRDSRETAKWCRGFLQKGHPAWGCTKSRPPWRVVSTLRPQGVRPSSAFILAHELWHLKGYWSTLYGPRSRLARSRRSASQDRTSERIGSRCCET